MPVGPVVLGLFLFLVVGSALFQVLNSSMNAGIVEWKWELQGGSDKENDEGIIKVWE